MWNVHYVVGHYAIDVRAKNGARSIRGDRGAVVAGWGGVVNRVVYAYVTPTHNLSLHARKRGCI